MSVLCVSVCKCVHVTTFLRAVVWPLTVCFSVRVCTRVCVRVLKCLRLERVGACLRVVVPDSSFKCPHVSPQLPPPLYLAFSYLLFSSFHFMLPSSLPPHVAPSLLAKLNTERHNLSPSTPRFSTTFFSLPSLYQLDRKYQQACYC